MTEIPIPDVLARSAASFGAGGVAWLESLPSRVDELVRRWDLELEPSSWAGYCALVLPVVRPDGERCVLKVQWPHEEAEHEADALRAYDGDGAVRVLDADDEHNAMLLERCVPGGLAWDAGDREVVVEVCAGVMTRLWRPVADDAPFNRRALTGERSEKIRRRFVEFGRPFDASLAEAGAAMFDELAASASQSALLHGDFHPYNVLGAEREPWLAIDPKPLVGDPAFDCAQLLLNFVGHGWPAAWSIASLADVAGVDRDRAWGWTFARTVEEVTRSLADGKAIDDDLERAELFAGLRP